MSKGKRYCFSLLHTRVAILNRKRSFLILEREASGQFVPVCTKNVFLKVYTKDMKQEDIQLWGEKDKSDYVDAMIQLLKNFFEGGNL